MTELQRSPAASAEALYAPNIYFVINLQTQNPENRQRSVIEHKIFKT